VGASTLRQPRPRSADGPGDVTLVSRTGARSAWVRCTAGRGTCLSQHDRLHPPPHAKTRCNRDAFFVSRASTDPFVWSPAFRRSRPAKAGTTCNSPRLPCFVTESAAASAEIVHRGGPFGADVCNGDEFSGMASEERRCFGVRAAERSVDAALVVPEEANPLTPIESCRQLSGSTCREPTESLC
jgi:hypothetical protein